jgi:hypothetical protein
VRSNLNLARTKKTVMTTIPSSMTTARSSGFAGAVHAATDFPSAAATSWR